MHLEHIIVFLISGISCGLAIRPTVPRDILVMTPELVSRTGRHSVQQHAVYTPDGYVLQMHRVRALKPRLSRRVSARPPVFIMHGIIASSEDFFRLGENRSLGYLLANKGYDVWVGNYRGNLYSSHMTMFKSHPKFWEFGWEEHGMSDLPAMLEYVMGHTGARGVHYVGHSMGTTGYMVMCHARPDLAQRIVSFTAMSPVYSLNKAFEPAARLTLQIGIPAFIRGINLDPVVFREPEHRILLSLLCHGKAGYTDNCYRNIYSLLQQDMSLVDWEITPLFFAKLQPATLRQLEHYIQVIVAGELRRFDYGYEGNMKRYGRSTPETFNITANVAPSVIYYADNDLLVQPENALRYINELKTRNPEVTPKRIPIPTFGHIDFIFSNNVHKIVNNDIVKMIEKYSKKYGHNYVAQDTNHIQGNVNYQQGIINDHDTYNQNNVIKTVDQSVYLRDDIEQPNYSQPSVEDVHYNRGTVDNTVYGPKNNYDQQTYYYQNNYGQSNNDNNYLRRSDDAVRNGNYNAGNGNNKYGQDVISVPNSHNQRSYARQDYGIDNYNNNGPQISYDQENYSRENYGQSNQRSKNTKYDQNYYYYQSPTNTYYKR